MRRQLWPHEITALEALIDNTSLATVLRTIRDICDEKANHIRANWQDWPLAAHWDKAAIQVGNTCERSAVAHVSEG